jgi:hypothetical protein
MKLGIAIGLVLLTVVSGCDRGNKQDDRGLLEKISNRTGPDELAVVPQDPLVAPTNFSTLPPPNPGGSNLADLTPGFDAVVALTGSAPRGNGAVAGDAALVAAVVARAGTAPEDGFNFFGFFGGNSDLLDAQAELLRLRALGIRTPAAPAQ